MPFEPTPRPLNVGEVYATTRQIYAGIIEEQAKVAELFVKTIGGPYEAEARDLLDRVERLRLRAMAQVVVTLGKLLGHVQEARDRIQTSQPGLQEFDQRFADIKVRYNQLYKPYFNYVSGNPVIPETKSWTSKEWKELRNKLEGPILFWSPKDCEEKWAYPNIPDCNGPDYFEAWSMTNQIVQAEDTEAELVGSVAGYLDWKLGDYAREAAETASELADKVGAAVERATEFARTEVLPPLLMGAGAVLALSGLTWIFSRLPRRD